MVLAVALLALAGALAFAAWPRETTAADRTDRIASELRCPVCQGLSAKDSPTDTARAMRTLVAQRVAEGRSDDEIREEFRRSYGDWVFLSPPLAGAGGLVWLVPLLLVGVGAAIAIGRVRAPTPPVPTPTADELARLRERVTREEAAS
jgi:cytochrome c-type biogenesis protein CcmH